MQAGFLDLQLGGLGLCRGVLRCVLEGWEQAVATLGWHPRAPWARVCPWCGVAASWPSIQGCRRQGHLPAGTRMCLRLALTMALSWCRGPL